MLATEKYLEEVGVEIAKPIYQGSQSWPFGSIHRCLVTARSGCWATLALDGDEIIDAQWFKYDRLPKLPPKASISRGMIDAFISERIN